MEDIQKLKQKLTDIAAEIQPDKTFDTIKDDLDDKSKEVYHFMEEFYKQCCEKDISFQLVFTLPKEYRPIYFWRSCEIDTDEGFERHNKSLHKQFWLMWGQLYNAGFLKYLEDHNIMKLLVKPENKTCQEKILDNAVLD
jgi:hypothetical protein